MNPFQSMLYQGISVGGTPAIVTSVYLDRVDGTTTNTITFPTTAMAEGNLIIMVFRCDAATPTSASITGFGGVTVTIGTRTNGLNDTIGILSFVLTAGMLGASRDVVLDVSSPLHAHAFRVGNLGSVTQKTLQGVTNGATLNVTASGISGNQVLVGAWNATTTTAGTPTTVTNSLTPTETTGTQVGVVGHLVVVNGSQTATLGSDAGTGQMIAACWFAT